MSQGEVKEANDGGGGEHQVGIRWDTQQWMLSSGINNGTNPTLPASARAPDRSCSNSPTATGLVLDDKLAANVSGASIRGSSSSKGGGSANEGTKSGGGGGVVESDHEIHIWTERERRKKMRNMFSSLHALLPQLPPKADKSTIVDEAVKYIRALQQRLHKLQQQKLDRIHLRGSAAAAFEDSPSSSSFLVLRSPPGTGSETATATTSTTREAFLADQAKNWLAAAPTSSPAASTIARIPQCFQTWSSPNVVLSVAGEDAHISVCSARRSGLLSTIVCVMEKHKLEVVSATISSDLCRCMIMIHARNGVRGLMLDMYDLENDIWLCHSFGGNCYDYTAFQPAIDVLREIQAFLEVIPSEIITIFIEDYVTAPMGLTKVFTDAELIKYWFPVSRMPKSGEDWPILSDMISSNQRFLVFTSKSEKEATEGIAYECSYVVENQYGDGGMEDGSCPHRAESLPMNSLSRSLVLKNYFPTAPELVTSCKHNSSPLESMLNTCHSLSANRWPNFIAVDFYRFLISVSFIEVMEVEHRKPLIKQMSQCNILYLAEQVHSPLKPTQYCWFF